MVLTYNGECRTKYISVNASVLKICIVSFCRAGVIYMNICYHETALNLLLNYILSVGGVMVMNFGF